MIFHGAGNQSTISIVITSSRRDPVSFPRRVDRQSTTVASAAAIAILYVMLRLPGIHVPLDRDEGAFGYMGQLINRGGAPYADGLDHKPPVAFYLNALALHFAPATAGGIHWFLLCYNFVTLVCVLGIAWIYFETITAGLWCAFAYAVFSSSPAIQGFTASTEMWALLPLSINARLLDEAADRDTSFRPRCCAK